MSPTPGSVPFLTPTSCSECLWPVAWKPCPALGFVSADGHRDDVAAAALAKERDCLFSFALLAIFGHSADLRIRRSRTVRVVGVALGVSRVHHSRIFPARRPAKPAYAPPAMLRPVGRTLGA